MVGGISDGCILKSSCDCRALVPGRPARPGRREGSSGPCGWSCTGAATAVHARRSTNSRRRQPVPGRKWCNSRNLTTQGPQVIGICGPCEPQPARKSAERRCRPQETLTRREPRKIKALLNRLDRSATASQAEGGAPHERARPPQDRPGFYVDAGTETREPKRARDDDDAAPPAASSAQGRDGRDRVRSSGQAREAAAQRDRTDARSAWGRRAADGRLRPSDAEDARTSPALRAPPKIDESPPWRTAARRGGGRAIKIANSSPIGWGA